MGSANVELTVQLTAPQIKPTRVRYMTMDGSARAGVDYEHMAGVISIPTGTLNATISISILTDDVTEPLGFLFVNLLDVEGVGLYGFPNNHHYLGSGGVAGLSAPGCTVANPFCVTPVMQYTDRLCISPVIGYGTPVPCLCLLFTARAVASIE